MKKQEICERIDVTRRRFLRSGAAVGLAAGLSRIVPAYARPRHTGRWVARPLTVKTPINLVIGKQPLEIAGREAAPTTINGSMPGPLLRFREGDDVTLRVTNQLTEDSSIHWHGLIVPPAMDGVPGVSFAGIKPGESFTYRFPVNQSGTYWYHSHSGLQEQTGVYGPLIVDPAGAEPFEFHRDYVVMLSDWTYQNPWTLLAKLKKDPGYYNYQRRTVGDFIRDVSHEGLGRALSDRLAWGRMRMDPTDIADVTAATYIHLMNGLPAEANWTALFRPGERVRLRFINGAAMSYFDIRIPGLVMTVVQADGQNVQPITVDEFRIAIAETYDVIVEPTEDRAYTIFAETMDRSGYARGTLAPRQGMDAPIPERRRRSVRSMADMGMADDMKAMAMDTPAEHQGHEPAAAEEERVMHGPDRHGPGNSAVAMVSRGRLREPGAGLENTGTRVLVYSDLRSLTPASDQREPERTIELHLTGNMQRYMWSFDGKRYSEGMDPIRFVYGERLRLTFVNDTMMEHPIHLHGMWMELDNGAGPNQPRKHTVNVKPAERLSVLVTADDPGKWALHCHLLLHLEVGMFRVVAVTEPNQGAAS